MRALPSTCGDSAGRDAVELQPAGNDLPEVGLECGSLPPVIGREGEASRAATRICHVAHRRSTATGTTWRPGGART